LSIGYKCYTLLSKPSFTELKIFHRGDAMKMTNVVDRWWFGAFCGRLEWN